MRKPFMPLLVVAVVLGVVLGGAFTSGVALGKSQGEEIDFTQEPGRFRQQSQGQSGQGGLTGIIEKVEGNTVTITTFEGTSLATIEVDTIIGMFIQGVPGDLRAGMQITVVGHRGQGDTTIARSVLLNPQDAYGFFGRGLLPGYGQQPVQTAESSDADGQEHSPNVGGVNSFFFGGGQGHGPASGGASSGAGQHSP